MTTALRAALVLCAIMVAGCGGSDDRYASLGPRYEARAWLAANANPGPLASNRFPSPAAAVAFVDSLYALGADTVYVVNVEQDSSWIREEGGPYSDALLLRLPSDRGKRAALFAINDREAGAEGFDRTRDRGQRYLFFWWD